MANIVNYQLVPCRDYFNSVAYIPLSAQFTRHPIPCGWTWQSSQGAGSVVDRPTLGQIWPRGASLSESAGLLSQLADVELTSLLDGDQLVWDDAAQKWRNSRYSITHYNDSCTFSGPTDTHDFTISAVDVNKSFIIPTASSPPDSTVALVGFVSPTSVRFILNAGSTPQNATVNFYVVELP